MITSLFKNNLLSYFIVALLGVIFWGEAYFGQTMDRLVSISIANQEFFFSRRSAILFSFIITPFGAALLNYKLKKYLFTYEPTNLFLLFYLFISLFGLHSSSIITYNLVSFLLVLLVNYLFYFIENKKQEDQIFNSAFIIGLLIFQNLSFVLLIPLLILNLGAVKRIEIKELALIIIGFLLPTLFVLLFTILTENLEILKNLFQFEIIYPEIPWKFAGYFLVLIYFSVRGYRLVVKKRTGIDINIIRLTKNMFVYFIAMSVIVGLSLFLFPKEYVAFIFVIPLSIFLSDFFSNSSFRFKELLFLILILIPVLFRFIN